MVKRTHHREAHHHMTSQMNSPLSLIIDNTMSSNEYLNKWHKLAKYEPNVNQTNIRCSRKLTHYTEGCNRQQTQTIVQGNFQFVKIYLMNKFVVTNRMERLTVTAASKQKDLKNVVAQDMSSRRKEGRQVVRSSLVSRRLNTISIFRPADGTPV